MSTRKAQGAVATPLPFAELAPLPAGVFVETKGFPVKLGRRKHGPVIVTDYGPNEYPCLHGECWRQPRRGYGTPTGTQCPACPGHIKRRGRVVDCDHDEDMRWDHRPGNQPPVQSQTREGATL